MNAGLPFCIFRFHSTNVYFMNDLRTSILKYLADGNFQFSLGDIYPLLSKQAPYDIWEACRSLEQQQLVRFSTTHSYTRLTPGAQIGQDFRILASITQQGVDHIRLSQGNYTNPFGAPAAISSPEKKKNRAWILPVSIAAGLILIGGIGVFFIIQKNKKKREQSDRLSAMVDSIMIADSMNAAMAAMQEAVLADSLAAAIDMSEPAYTYAEEMPEAGFNLTYYLSNNIQYPAYEQSAGIEGTVYVSFVVEKDGSISEVKAEKEVSGGPGLTREAIRVIESMPAWTPGKMNGTNVRVKMTQPIKFSIR